MNDIKALVGQRIKTIRKYRKYTQEQLAELIGIEPQSLSYMETGKFSPSPDTLQKLGEVLKVQPYEFYYFEQISEKEMENTIVDVIKTDKKFLKMVYNLYKSMQYNLGK
ncbi:MAG: XRE family transcriptional regulator [Candidatus Melainabacteria bacterium]|nr:MAG: XRE family transcriptional regulator [Candidatus Melainabacteria bacterium]